jgi:hypothetical protein
MMNDVQKQSNCMEATCFPEMLVDFQRTSQPDIPEDIILNPE